MIGRPSECLEVVGRPSRMSGSCRESLLDFREWSGARTGCPSVVGRLSRMSWSGRETLGDLRE